MRTCFALLLVCLATTPALLAQWSLSPEIGLTAFGGSGRDSSGLRVGPTRASVVALRVGRESPHLGIGVRVLTGSTGFGASDGELTVIQEHQLRLLEFAGLVSWHLARIGTSSRLGLDAGPVLDIWTPHGASTRARFGAAAAVVWAFPVTARLAAALRLEGTLTSSLFDAADVPAGAERRATWRRGVSFALARRL